MTFEKGNFLFKEIEDSKFRIKLSKNPAWKNLGDDTFSTKELKEAAEFRKFADEKCESILRKRLQEYYNIGVPILKKDINFLDSHQIEGLHHILSRKRSYLAHAPGAGKTAQAIIASFYSIGTGKILFIVPPSLTKNWEREIWKFSDLLDIWPEYEIISTLKEIIYRAKIIICPDSLLSRKDINDKLLEIDFKFIAVDEASRFKDPFSQRSLSFYGGKFDKISYKGLYLNARYVVFLDGSPMPNRPIELWAPLYALDPESIDCLNYDDFGYRYCGARPNERGVWEYKYSSNEKELQEKIQKNFMHVVNEDRLNHPERLRSIIVMNEDVRSIDQKNWEKSSIALFNTRNKIKEEFSRGEMAHFRKELGLRKTKWVAEYVEEKLEKEETILVFTWHRDVCDKLALLLSKFSPILVKGGMGNKERELAISSFGDKNQRLLIGNIAAMGRGHNLPQASRCIFAEFSWSDETNKQAEKRASRKGSVKKKVRCDYIVCPDSMDEIILNSLFRKEKRVRKIIG